MAMVPPVRAIDETRLWTATRGSGRDATFDDSMANLADGTPTPEQVAARTLFVSRKVAPESTALIPWSCSLSNPPQKKSPRWLLHETLCFCFGGIRRFGGADGLT